jgi:hypothetical protein
MTVTITHVYDDYNSAENVVRELEGTGFTSDQISVVGREPAGREREEGAEGAATGATLGGVAGAGAGLLASPGLIGIPGIGPLVAAGVLATTVAGAATGAIAGGLLGALVDYGISKEKAPVYGEAEHLSRSGRRNPGPIRRNRSCSATSRSRSRNGTAPTGTRVGRATIRTRHLTARRSGKRSATATVSIL